MILNWNHKNIYVSETTADASTVVPDPGVIVFVYDDADATVLLEMRLGDGSTQVQDLPNILSAGSAYTADETSLHLTGSVFSVKDAGVTLAKMANLAANSILGNNTGSAATPIALTAAQVKALLAIAAADITDASSNGRSFITAANYAAMKALLAIAAADITDASANGRSFITAANYAAMKALLDLEIGTDIPALNHASRHQHGGADEIAVDTSAANAIPKALGTGKLDTSWLPDSVLGQLEYQGGWAASTNTPAIPAADSTNKGQFYIATDSVAAGHGYPNIADIAYDTGDWLVSNGSSWDKIDNTDAVSTVFGRLGAIIAAASDYDASQVDNDSGVSGAFVDDALDWLLANKLALASHAAVSVIGRSANSSGDAADIAAGANDTILRRVSDALGFGQITLGMAPANLWTNAKLAQVATATVKGRNTAGTGDVEDLTMTQLKTLLTLGTAAFVDTGTGAANVPTITQADARYILQSLVAAKGDIIGASANDTPAITTAGANGTVLKADSAQSTGLRWATQPGIGFIMLSTGTAAVWTNLPATADFFQGTVQRSVFKFDLTEFTQCRLMVLTGSVAGFAGSKMTVKYKTSTYSTTAANYSDIGTSAVTCTVDAADTQTDSGWVDLASAAKADVQVALMGKDGNGVVDPSFHFIQIQFR